MGAVREDFVLLRGLDLTAGEEEAVDELEALFDDTVALDEDDLALDDARQRDLDEFLAAARKARVTTSDAPSMPPRSWSR